MLSGANMAESGYHNGSVGLEHGLSLFDESARLLAADPSSFRDDDLTFDRRFLRTEDALPRLHVQEQCPLSSTERPRKGSFISHRRLERPATSTARAADGLTS